MIEVKNLTKSFDGRTVLHGVDATLYTGKTNLIIGQSGSGKTVLMKSLVGLLRPEEGQILFDGRDLLTMKRDEIAALRKGNRYAIPRLGAFRQRRLCSAM